MWQISLEVTLKTCKYPILILRVVVTWHLQIFVDVCIAPISLYYHACTKAGFDNMIYNNKKHFYDPYDSLDAEWKARISHEMLSVGEAAQLSGFSRQDINRTMPRCLRRKWLRLSWRWNNNNSKKINSAVILVYCRIYNSQIIAVR